MTIICGTDLSPASEGAVSVACALAALRDEQVVLVHVADYAGNETVRDRLIDEARVKLDASAASCGDRVRTELAVSSSPPQTLIGFAEAEGANLIVIAASSLHTSHAPVMRLGTTAAKLIATSSVPVLCVRDPAPWLAFARRQRPLRLLIGVDDSAVCDLGIQWIHGLRKLAPVEVVLGAIYYPDEAAARYGLHARNAVDRDPEVEALLARDLVRRFGTRDAPDVVARPRRGLGRIGDHVVELAREENVDAILVGTGQKTGLGRLGSVSSVIVADATQSVLCVPPQAAIPTIAVPQLRSALVATDLSQFANRAVAYAFSIASEDVHIVHVIDDDDDKADEAELQAQLRALAPASARQKVHAHVVRGSEPAVTLARTAARHGVDIVCISSHGRTGIARALVGSVADQLLRATRLPVLVLRPA